MVIYITLKTFQLFNNMITILYLWIVSRQQARPYLRLQFVYLILFCPPSFMIYPSQTLLFRFYWNWKGAKDMGVFMQLWPPVADDTGRGAHGCCLPSASAHTQTIWHHLRNIINRWLVYISHLHSPLIHFFSSSSTFIPEPGVGGGLDKENSFRTESPGSLRQRTHDWLWLIIIPPPYGFVKHS